jgi:uncharacterized membrane protein
MPVKLKSRKFWMAVCAAALVVANEGLGLGIDGETVTKFVALILGYIITEGAVDIKDAGK